MKITWLGHSSFLLEESTGTKIVTDPYHSYVGYEMPDVDADIVTVSHAHNDHCCVSKVGGDPTVPTEWAHTKSAAYISLLNARITTIKRAV